MMKVGAPKLGEEKLIFHTPEQRAAITARLYQLYVVEERGTPEMARLLNVATHKSVLRALHHYGIPVRPRSSSKHRTCIEEGCSLLVHRILHRTNGSRYGRRCRLHWIIFRMAVNQRYINKTLKCGKDEAWLIRMRQSLRRAQRLNREVSQSLRPGSAPATTSPA